MLLSACGTYKFTYQLDSNDYPVKGDNVIKVNTSKSDQENFDDFSRHLVSKGFSFESRDSELLLLVTNSKEADFQIHHKFIVSFRSETIYVRSEIRLGYVEGSGWESWYYTDVWNSVSKAFNYFFPFIYEYSKDIEFEKV
jgi:hypothetical protein